MVHRNRRFMCDVKIASPLVVGSLVQPSFTNIYFTNHEYLCPIIMKTFVLLNDALYMYMQTINPTVFRILMIKRSKYLTVNKTYAELLTFELINASRVIG